MTDGLWLVVGLGNPGATYAGTRHNVGYAVLDELVARSGGALKAHKQRADVCEGRVSGVRAVLTRPRSYMNESGGPVKALLDYYKVRPASLLVIHDELDIPLGALRLKFGGGDNGHNGLKSIRSALGTGDFHRLRFGIGRPPGRQAPRDFVLKPFSTAEREHAAVDVVRAADAVETLLADGLTVAQNLYHPDPA